MMRWGSKKKASSSSSSSFSSYSSSSSTYIHSVSRVFSIPWLSKFKRVSISSDSEAVKEQQNGKLKSGSEKFQSFGSRETGSIGKQGFDGLKTLNRKRSVVRENTEDLPDVKTCERENGVIIKTPRLPVQSDRKWKKSNAAIHKRSSEKSPGTGKKTIAMILEEKCSSNRNSTRKENGVSETPRGNSAFSREELEGQEKKLEGKKYKEKKMKEVKAKSEEHHRKSLYISSEIKGGRSKQKQRFKSVSPRASPKAEFCRFKALNNMKREKLKIKTHVEGQTGLGSHPVVKYSPDPQKDFKDSMVEMIAQKRIWRPEELEELLACYLTLNSAEYHDMIVNAFQQVWLDLNKSHLGY